MLSLWDCTCDMRQRWNWRVRQRLQHRGRTHSRLPPQMRDNLLPSFVRAVDKCLTVRRKLLYIHLYSPTLEAERWRISLWHTCVTDFLRKMPLQQCHSNPCARGPIKKNESNVVGVDRIRSKVELTQLPNSVSGVIVQSRSSKAAATTLFRYQQIRLYKGDECIFLESWGSTSIC